MKNWMYWALAIGGGFILWKRHKKPAGYAPGQPSTYVKPTRSSWPAGAKAGPGMMDV